MARDLWATTSWLTLGLWFAATILTMRSAYVAKERLLRRRSLVACATLLGGSILFIVLDSIPAVPLAGSILSVVVIALSAWTLATGLAVEGGEEQESGTSGVRSPEPPAADLSRAEVLDHYLEGWEAEYARARRVVKRRASLVTIWTTSLSGLVAVFGAVSAALATDLWVEVISVMTTAASATAAVLLAWNAHFHHAELWVQRSGVLSQLQALRLDVELSKRSASGEEGDGETKTTAFASALKEILKKDAEDWANIKRAGS